MVYTYQGVEMVVMNRQDYIDKVQQLLTDHNTYRPVNKYPTNRLKNKLTQSLRDIKAQGGLSDHKYRRLYPTSAVPPKFYGPPKYIKLAPSSGPLFLVGVPLLRGGKGVSQHYQTPSLPISPSHLKYPTVCGLHP